MSGRFPFASNFANDSNNNWRQPNKSMDEATPNLCNAPVIDIFHGRGRGRGRGRSFNNPGPSNRRLNQYQADCQLGPEGRPPRFGFFGFKRLEELLIKEPEEALVIFVSNIAKVKNYLNSNELTPDIIVLMFEVLAKVIGSKFAESVSQVLLAMLHDSFLESVNNFIMKLPLEDNTTKNKDMRFWSNPNQFFLNMALTVDAMIEVLPSTALDIAPRMVKAITYILPNLEEEHHVEFSDEFRRVNNDIQQKLKRLLDKKEEKEKKKTNACLEDEQEPPPNDFHEIDVYPNALEITTRMPTFLRKNVIKGAYKDVYHYLDVQYRLLREDFVAPLRNGICEYFDMIRDGRKQQLSNIKIYKDVRALAVVPNVNQVGYLLQVFKPKSIKNMEHSRRFMFGSLVCLTPDNFTTIIFGKIIDRDKKFLNEGRVVLGFDVGVELDLNSWYILVECTIYFEPYYQVLTALKRMNELHFPFKEYLVDVRTESELPDYLSKLDPRQLARYHDIITNDDPPETKLNPSQLAAYRAAMTSKFCIVQGPPGTGKTYLALKVARMLLEFKNLWKKAPMLVICYTNHALDQFLEGLLPQTENLLRVGGQSKNERLQKYNLRNLRMDVPAVYFRTQHNSREELEECAHTLSRYGAILQAIDEYASVLRFSVFDELAVDSRFAGSWFHRATNEQLSQWLLYQPNNKNEVKFADLQAVTQIIDQQNYQCGEGAVEIDDSENVPDNPLNQRMRNRLDIDDHKDFQLHFDRTVDMINVGTMNKIIQNLTRQLSDMCATGQQNTFAYLTVLREMFKVRIDYDYVRQQLLMLKRQEGEATIHVDYENPKFMPANDRWLLYGNWVRRYKRVVMARYIEADVDYRYKFRKFTEVKDMLDLYKMKHVDVIGMTTTGAARLHKTLQALGCPIVIVEEAAEVLEAHIITALSPCCEHLILIGDHKQLKPSTADYKITNEYNLGVSLFERMVGNGLHCHMLDVQHRMRPEIANLVCPAIYPTLHNHASVELYPKVTGVDAPLYFVTHDHRESESQDRSKENHFEAEYLIQLARYLVLNGYDASRITIIAAYSGQWFVLLRLKKKFQILYNMRISILDNFQGEENDIILLSLVRNNVEGKNGFLNLENRICVALSRAKHGMYIMGNMKQLCDASPIWRQVSTVLEKYDALGPYLTVRCVNHPDHVTHLCDTEDFQKVPEGGCLKSCNKGLECGHTCAKLCHSTSHDDYECHQPCQKVLCEFDHVCPDKCYMECNKCKVSKLSTLPCGHSANIHCHQSPEEVLCYVKLPTVLPCGHPADKPCHADPNKFTCPHPCDARVEPCGHACIRPCHVRNDPNHERYNCTKQCVNSNKGCTMPDESKHPCEKSCCEPCDMCKVEIQKRRSCDHYYDVKCSADVEEVDCKRPCKRKLGCGHTCFSSCNELCGPCKIKVQKVIAACSHPIEWECGMEPAKHNCKSKTCPATLDCGHPCPLPCALDCITAKCMFLVPTKLATPCGHVVNVPCHMRAERSITNQLLAYCTAKCCTTQECGHACPGTCGKCAQGRFHIPCAEKCDKTLICGHGCATPCVQNCKPCTNQCHYKCEHSKCTKRCGVPCTSCMEMCNRRCKHQYCTKKCGEMCSVPPCEQPCPELLQCGHPCIGFCGDICPPLCRLCNADEVTEVFFGTEEEEDARFVYLVDCKHTLESTGLDRWFGADGDNQDVFQVKVPCCPKCKTNVQVPRYRDYIKEAHKNVQMIKHEFFGDPKELRDLTKELQDDIIGAKELYSDNICKPVLSFFADKIKTTGKSKKRQDNCKANLISLRARYDIFKQLATIRYHKATPGQIPLANRVAKQLVDDNLTFLFSKLAATEVSITKQQIQEFQMEILRFNRINQMARAIEMNPSATELTVYAVCHRQILTFIAYDAKQDAVVKCEIEALHLASKTGLEITEVERKEIVGAFRMLPGHWFKCANGHIYVITECGGAMELAKCPECGLTIGGTNHALTAGNLLAPEMDGARRPAYPTGLTPNNMLLYRF